MHQGNVGIRCFKYSHNLPEDAIKNVVIRSCPTKLTYQAITVKEIELAVKQMKKNKAPGNEIASEVNKYILSRLAYTTKYFKNGRKRRSYFYTRRATKKAKPQANKSALLPIQDIHKNT